MSNQPEIAPGQLWVLKRDPNGQSWQIEAADEHFVYKFRVYWQDAVRILRAPGATVRCRRNVFLRKYQREMVLDIGPAYP